MDNNSPRPYTFDRVARILFTLTILGGLIYLVYYLRGALLPFFVAWLIAYMLHPLIKWVQKILHLRFKILAIIITLVLLTGFLVGISLLLIPPTIQEFERFFSLVSRFVSNNAITSIFPASISEYISNNLDIQQINHMLETTDWPKLIEQVWEKAWNIIAGSVSQIIRLIGWFIVLIYVIFILLDYEHIIDGFKHLIPIRYRPFVQSILSDVEIGMNKYFRGQALIAFFVGILFSIGFLIIDLPLAIPLGLFIGALNLVPYLQIVGVLPTIMVCMIYSMDTGSSFWIILLLSGIVFCVVQLIQDLYLTPKIMGKATGLNPAIILLSLSIWGTLMGIIGMIIALPITSLLLSYYQRFIINKEPITRTIEEKKSEIQPTENEDKKEEIQ